MSGSPEKALSVSGLNKSYNVPVLKDFDFDLRKGEVHALIGSNGAGKSTFAKILTGLTPRNSGEVKFHGRPFNPASKQEASVAGINMVLQELNIIPTLTIAENLWSRNAACFDPLEASAIGTFSGARVAPDLTPFRDHSSHHA